MTTLNGIKHIFLYFHRTTELGLFYLSELTKNPTLLGYADTSYLSHCQKTHSQTRYVFTYNGFVTIKTFIATSSNHSKILGYMK